MKEEEERPPGFEASSLLPFPSSVRSLLGSQVEARHESGPQFSFYGPAGTDFGTRRCRARTRLKATESPGPARYSTHNIIGDLCGVDGRTSYLKATAAYRLYDVRELPYAYYLPSGAVVCVESCPSADDADRFFCHYETQEALDGYLADGDVDAYWRAGVAGSVLRP